MGLKESLRKLQEDEQRDRKLSLKRELKKELTKLKNEKISQKKCVECGKLAKYSIKGSNDWYCKECAVEYFGDLKNLKKNNPSFSKNDKKRSLKIYIAAKFEQRLTVQYLYKKIIEKGHTITYDWTNHDPIKPYDKNIQKARSYSENELKGIVSSDIFIYISYELGTTLPMEFGAALACRKIRKKPKIYVLGEAANKSPWFFNESVIRKNSIKEILEDL